MYKNYVLNGAFKPQKHRVVNENLMEGSRVRLRDA
jgi:hypothetical protein